MIINTRIAYRYHAGLPHSGGPSDRDRSAMLELCYNELVGVVLYINILSAHACDNNND